MKKKFKVTVVMVPIVAIAFFMLAPIVYFPTTILNACNGCSQTYAGYESPSCELFHVGSGYYTKEISTIRTLTVQNVTEILSGGHPSTSYFLGCPHKGYGGLPS